MSGISLVLQASIREALLPRPQTKNRGCLRPRWHLTTSARASIQRVSNVNGLTFEAFISQKLVPKLW